MKKFIVQVWSLFRQTKWEIFGWRKLKVMGHSINLDTSSSLFLSWKDLQIKKHWKHGIVRHVDLVQLNALCETVSKMSNNPVIVDVGAYQGMYAILLGMIVKEKHGKVLAIEPVPKNAEILLKNILLNNLENVVTIEQTAVGNTSGKVRMSSEDIESVIRNEGNDLIDVNIDRLDSILERNHIDNVDVLIIDVEGAELRVLESFPWGKIKIPYIMCELHPYNWKDFGYSGVELMEFFKKKKLRCIDMYFQVYDDFTDNSYIGPCLLLPDNLLCLET
jgi:FkbM family methyltransferase